MADATTPSALAMSIGESLKAESTKPASSTKPEKPDELAFTATKTKLSKALDEAKLKLDELEAKFNGARPNIKDSPNAVRQAQLKTDLQAIRAKQQTHKSSRASVQDQVSKLDGQLKGLVADQKTARSRNPYKSTTEIDERIRALEAQVASATMKIVDEKKALNEISGLNRQKKDFAGFDSKQKDIDAVKAQIAEKKKEYDNPESKALSAEYDTKQAELNELKKEADVGYKERDSHREAFFAQKKKTLQARIDLKKLQDDYYGAKRAWNEHEKAAKEAYRTKKREEQVVRDRERKERVMADELEAARAPAYLDHINSCNALIRILDPSSTLTGAVQAAASSLMATAQRLVDDSGIKGTRLASKKDEDEESYFVGTGGKKGKKGKNGRGPAAEGESATTKAVALGTFYTPGVSEHFERIGVKAPSSTDDQPRVLEEVKEKKKFYEENQDKKTEENIADVTKKLEALKASDASEQANRRSSSSEPKTNGHAADEASKSAPKENGVSAVPVEANVTSKTTAQ